VTNTSPSSVVFNFEAIQQRLDHGELFVRGTWLASSIRRAGYDLRVGDEAIVVPKAPGDNQDVLSYPRGKKRTQDIVLARGQVAFLSTMERLRMPTDITGHIGVKFSLASKGVLILTGLFVDPGFGWTDDMQQGESLHFLMANLGAESVTLVPGQTKIATVQFLRLDEPRETDISKWPSLGQQDIEKQFFDIMAQPIVGLAFVQQIAGLQQEVARVEPRLNAAVGRVKQIEDEVAASTAKTLVDTTTTINQKVDAQIADVQRKIADVDQRLQGVVEGTQQIVLFGVFLVCATLLGVSVTIILNFVANVHDMLVAIVGIVAITAIFGSALYIIYTKVFRPDPDVSNAGDHSHSE